MTFPTDDIYPPPRPRSWGLRRSCVGVVWHTTEYANALRSSAIACARDQARRDAAGNWLQPGSYNFILYDPTTTDAKGGALLTVPFLEASGGMTVPGSSSWAPDAWLSQLLPAAAVADPAMHHVQIALSGKTADYAAGRVPNQARIIDVAARLALWIEREAWGADNLVFSGHMHWQDNRSDPSAQVLDQILARMAAIGAPAPAPTPPPDYEALYRAELAKVSSLTAKVIAERARVTVRDAHIDKYPRT